MPARRQRLCRERRSGERAGRAASCTRCNRTPCVECETSHLSRIRARNQCVLPRPAMRSCWNTGADTTISAQRDAPRPAAQTSYDQESENGRLMCRTARSGGGLSWWRHDVSEGAPAIGATRSVFRARPLGQRRRLGQRIARIARRSSDEILRLPFAAFATFRREPWLARRLCQAIHVLGTLSLPRPSVAATPSL